MAVAAPEQEPVENDVLDHPQRAVGGDVGELDGQGVSPVAPARGFSRDHADDHGEHAHLLGKRYRLVRLLGHALLRAVGRGSVVGDPERCYQKMKHYADLGVDQLICYVQFGHNSHESVMKTIELLGKEVLPELEGYKANIASS